MWRPRFSHMSKDDVFSLPTSVLQRADAADSAESDTERPARLGGVGGLMAFAEHLATNPFGGGFGGGARADVTGGGGGEGVGRGATEGVLEAGGCAPSGCGMDALWHREWEGRLRCWWHGLP